MVSLYKSFIKEFWIDQLFMLIKLKICSLKIRLFSASAPEHIIITDYNVTNPSKNKCGSINIAGPCHVIIIV